MNKFKQQLQFFSLLKQNLSIAATCFKSKFNEISHKLKLTLVPALGTTLLKTCKYCLYMLIVFMAVATALGISSMFNHANATMQNLKQAQQQQQVEAAQRQKYLEDLEAKELEVARQQALANHAKAEAQLKALRLAAKEARARQAAQDAAIDNMLVLQQQNALMALQLQRMQLEAAIAELEARRLKNNQK